MASSHSTMKTISITRLCKDVEYTMNKDVFELRLKFKQIPDKYVGILWKFYFLIKFTDYTPVRIKDLLTRDTTYQDVADRHGVTLGAVKTEMFLFTKSLAEIFPIDFVGIIRDGGDIEESYHKYVDLILDELIDNSKVDFYDLKDSFTVDIFKSADIEGDFSHITDDDYIKLRNKLVTFSKPSQQFIFENMDRTLVNYGVYLLVTKEENLNEQDRERKRDLMKFTKLEGNLES